MILDLLLRKLSCNPSRGLTAWGVAALLLVNALPVFGQAPADVRINNTVTATYQVNGTFFPAAPDSVAIIARRMPVLDSSAPGLRISKFSDTPAVALEGVVTYTIDFETTADGGPAVALEVTDVLPSTLIYVRGTLLLNGVPLSDAADGDAGTFFDATNTLVVRAGDVMPGTRGRIVFRARVAATARTDATIINEARVYQAANPESAARARAELGILRPVAQQDASLALTKHVDKAQAYSGDTLTYTIGYEAQGAGSLSGVSITDLIPSELRLVAGSLEMDAAVVTEVNGNGLTFRIATLRSSARGTIRFQAVIDNSAAPGTSIVNTARAGYMNHETAYSGAPATAVTTIASKPAALRIAKRVDLANAQAGDVVIFTIDYELVGPGSLNAVTITDTLSAALDFVSVSAGSYDASAHTVTIALGNLGAGASGSVALQTRVRAGTPNGTVITNRAAATYEHEGAPGSVTTDATKTTARVPEVTIRKSIIGAARAWFGDVIRYQIVVRNSSNIVTLHDITVTDTLPSGLALVAATPSSIGSAPVLSWSLADFAAGDSAIIIVDARVTQRVEAATVISNRAVVNARGAAAASAVELTVQPGEELQLSIELSSAVLEVTLGDVAPLTAEVTNTGYATLEDILVEITLPQGTAYVPGSLVGADSVAVVDGRLIVRLPAALAAGASTRFRYSIAIVAPSQNVLHNATTASAQNRTVFSNVSQLALRIRRNRAVETHTVLGNVWLDDNNNGRLDDGEEPAAGVDVWSNDGAVARTDENGRFSFTNVRVGTYVFRADPVTMPAGFSVPSNEDGLVRARVTGWTSPRVMLPLTRRADEAYTKSSAAPIAAQPAAPVDVTPEDTIVRVRTAPARTDEERSSEKGRAFTLGPAIEIFGVADGLVTGQKRLFVGARGEAERPIALFRGDSLIEQGKLRVDGVYDFLGVQLKAGPNILRVRTTNSWKKERWDSVLVHMSGAPTKLIPAASKLVVAADGATTLDIRVRVLDKWNVPVVNGPLLNVSVDGMTVVTPDAHATAVGSQVTVDKDGWAMVRVKAGLKVMNGTMRIASEGVKTDLPVQLVAPALPFMMIGTGEFGIGATADAFASITARGRLDDKTSLTVSVDTRRVENDDAAFGRSADPMMEGNYPILGDATERRAQSSSHATVAARIERGLDYVAFGDVHMGLSEDLALMRYDRSITGAAASVTTGAVKWTGFGALTTQALQQTQLRGRGTSGPYALGHAVVAGTDRLYVDVRDRENPQQIKNRQPLMPFVDYEIDYDNGVILLKRPLASVDAAGNPLFLVVNAETRGGGERTAVWGARAHTDLSELLNRGVRRLMLGASYVHDGQAVDAVQLAGVDVQYTPREGVALRAEVAHSQSKDSSGIAAVVEGSVKLFKDAVTLDGRYSRTGDGFGNPANVALETTTQDFRFGAALKIKRGQLRLEHSRQNFETQNIERSRTTLSVTQPIAPKTSIEARFVSDDAAGIGADRRSGAGEVKVTWSPTSRFKMWGESRGELWTEGAPSTGSYAGGGLAWQALQDVWLEARHLEMKNAAGAGYSTTNVGIKSTMLAGQQAWGSYQLTGGIDGATSAAVVGLNNRFALNNDLKINTLFERRMGIARAPTEDPVNALPFPQQESDYWSAGLGVEFLPAKKPYRVTAKGEHKTGQQEKVTSAMLSGDIALGNSFALLSRQEFMRHETGAAAETPVAPLEHKASIWGLALRPSSSNSLNALVELRWVSDKNPRGGQLVDRSGLDERLIGAAEMIWSPTAALELGLRYALRDTRSLLPTAGLPDMTVHSRASFSSLRAELGLTRWAALRAEARSLDEQMTNERAWDASPAMVLRPIQGIEISGGHRFGQLRDIDFAANGGEGWFMTMGFRVTEASLPGAAAFWRSRMGR